ncbi:NAD(P)/FAD-dependent oxidoreductase [Aquimarina brevivitae]|uniref:D-amino-acid dehydrogenase n=1 Tax=Aquimarina brevivitae TaxID=323412 RepID=A0A4V2F7G3_9FLAO|nr:FAD-dependent oxidoreductase [Aquimarina brevivitae]RZS99719.1 D-amino-acid dehydrogenase [Aquimarina brevivitae]
MKKKINIIGGGIIGLCSAYYLHKEGHEVTVIDQSSMDFGASYVNAGYLSPSHIIPLAAPGVMAKGIQWMFNPSSPLFIKPSLRPDFLQWVWAFNKSCSTKNVDKAIPAIKAIASLGRDLYDQIITEENFNAHLDKKGLLMLCQTEKALEEEFRVAAIARKEGLDVKIIAAEELERLEPNTKIEALGAVHFLCDWHSTPHSFMEELKSYLLKVGVTIIKNEKINEVATTHKSITAVLSENKRYTADEFIFTSGAWTKTLCKKIGVRLLLEPGKGYRINLQRDTGISLPAILVESKVAVTPMTGFTRFAGTMEIAGINHSINPVRVNAIASAAKKYYPEIEISEQEKSDAACGLRPVTPDGLPYIGRVSTYTNATVATGHAMLGWTMGASTGKLVSEIITNKKTSIAIDVFNPNRTF